MNSAALVVLTLLACAAWAPGSSQWASAMAALAADFGEDEPRSCPLRAMFSLLYSLMVLNQGPKASTYKTGTAPAYGCHAHNKSKAVFTLHAGDVYMSRMRTELLPLKCNALHCNTKHCNALQCNALHCTAMRCAHVLMHALTVQCSSPAATCHALSKQCAGLTSPVCTLAPWCFSAATFMLIVAHVTNSS